MEHLKKLQHIMFRNIFLTVSNVLILKNSQTAKNDEDLKALWKSCEIKGGGQGGG